MPQVPVYNGPQVRSAPLQPNYQNNVDVSSGTRALGQGLANMGEAFDRIAERDAEAKANEVDTELTRAWNDWEDKNRGAFTNKQADGYKAAVDGWWKEAAQKYGGDLDPRAKAMVGKTLSRRQTVALDQAGKHELVEKEKYADSTTLSAMDNARGAALRTGDYAGEAQRVRDLVASMGQRKNWDADQRKDETNNRLATFHSAVVSQLAEKDAGGAKTYLEDAIKRGEVDPDHQSRIEAVITKNYNDQEGKRISQSMAGKTYAEKQEELSKIKDAELREAASAHVDRDQVKLERAKTETVKAIHGEARLAYEKTGRVPPTMMALLEKTDPGVAAELLHSIKADQKARAREAKGEEIKTDQRAYFELRDKVLAGENVDPLAYRDRVSRSDLEEAKKLQEKLRNPAEQKREFTTERTIDNYRPQDVKKDSEEWTNLRRTMEDTIITARTAKGKELTDKEVREALDPLFVAGTIEKNWWPDSTKPRYQMTPEEQAKAKFPQASSDKFTTGQVYKDAKGNRAKYLGSGKWESVK